MIKEEPPGKRKLQNVNNNILTIIICFIRLIVCIRDKERTRKKDPWRDGREYHVTLYSKSKFITPPSSNVVLYLCTFYRRPMRFFRIDWSLVRCEFRGRRPFIIIYSCIWIIVVNKIIVILPENWYTFKRNRERKKKTPYQRVSAFCPRPTTVWFVRVRNGPLHTIICIINFIRVCYNRIFIVIKKK